MQYKNLFNKPFIEKLNHFFEKAVIIKNAEVDEYIDIESMLKRAGYAVKYIPCNDSFIVNKTIFVNPNMLLTRQRFVLAKTLGLLVNNHKEVLGNAFASRLLMPETLVVENIRHVVQSNHYDATELSKAQVETLIDAVANRLRVSSEALKTRINQLELLQETV